jgi:5-methylthioribose kinase
MENGLGDRLVRLMNAPDASFHSAEPGFLNIEEPEALAAYLKETGRAGRNEKLVIRPLAGGVSNRTVWVERSGGEAWVLKQALPRLRVAVEWFSDPARIEREAAGLQWLEKLAPEGTITPLVFEDRAHHLLCMKAVPHPHENWKTLLMKGTVSTDHIRQFGVLLGTVHRQAFELRGAISRAFENRAFFESLRIDPYYRYSAVQTPAAAPFLDKLIEAARRRRFTLVHGDYSPKNILVREGRLVLLDHEVIHFGDPAYDAGFALTHLLSKAHHLRARRGDFAVAAINFWQSYRQALGRVSWESDLEQFAIWHTLGCLLARVAGKSTLEYLNEKERRRQRETVVALMQQQIGSLADLVEHFLRRIEKQEAEPKT